MKRRFFGFSLVEMLVVLIIISCILAALTPVISKRLASSAITVAQGEMNEISTDCSENENVGEECKICSKQICIDCGLEGCSAGQFLDKRSCMCKDCKEVYGEHCIECDKNGCLGCDTKKYYIGSGTCITCPEKSYCDGKTIYATCPGNGFWCSEDTFGTCTSKYGAACNQCDENVCTRCLGGYYLKDDGCIQCSSACSNCLDENTCSVCRPDYLPDEQGSCTISCNTKITGCYLCTSEQTCTSCFSEYYLNTDKTCTKCELENCLKCLNDMSATNPSCAICNGAYYQDNDGACQACEEKFGQNCASCNINKCLSCKVGYQLASDATALQACEVISSNTFNCSDANFMKIGNICFTRKNMGDNSILTIPTNAISIAEVKQDICYSETSKCCWQGRTGHGCTQANGGYSGCDRTVCNWSAADEICKNFSYAGKTWRLPTVQEIENLNLYSDGLGQNGLMLCGHAHFDTAETCNYTEANNCLGSGEFQRCNAHRIWAEKYTNTRSYVYNEQLGSAGISDDLISKTASVRCVTEMN